MKTLKTIGTVMMVGGLFFAIATADGSKYEIILRAIGASAFAVGAWLNESYDFQQKGGAA